MRFKPWLHFHWVQRVVGVCCESWSFRDYHKDVMYVFCGCKERRPR